MVESVGNVESYFGIDSIVLRSFAHSALDIDDQVAGGAVFAGNRFAAEADDIRGVVFTEKFTVVLRDAGIVCQQQSNLLPDGARILSFKQSGELSGQPADCRQIDPAFLPVYQNGFHL